MRLLSKDNFFKYDLGNDDIIKSLVIFSAILSVVFVISKITLKEPKKLSWAIGLFNSFVTMIVGSIYLYIKVPSYNSFFFFGSGRDVFHGVDNISTLTCIWFGLANLFDLALGMFFYPKYLGLLTAYIHHSVFIWIMITATTGNGLFLTCERFAPSFLFNLIEEFPTFLLALGSVFPSFRTDIGFGVSFFFLRIVYHFYILILSIAAKIDTTVIVLYILTLMLHLHWFYNWITKYGKNLFNKKQSKKIE